ncbi:apolipoprotein N-acyltransferase [Glacieibacterium frigidum]|uniref:Apolipoprotein N-acyltransferase n=1 Tax=Glacieibacterium frigidum TaxID=2593303 RepID=A0A552UAI6_9SPHN|nr:apolipoprotein N-acyltransferase [Glacieibacterium frigidum]TRW15224.1 apolipoprotein N-acyltransferase [Glacieibacterium frigidum]
MSARIRFLIAFAAGALAACGFEPFGLWPLTMVAVAVLVWLLDLAQSRRGAFATGWWFGVGHFCVGLTWIATAFTYQAKMPPALGWVTVVLLSMFLSLYPGLATLATWWATKSRTARVFVLAAAWMLAEWLRGHVLSGFAWNPLGVAWLDTGVAQLGSLFGGLGLSGLMVLAGGAVMLALRHNRLSAALTLGAVCGVALLGGLLVPAPVPATGPMVHLVQPDIGQSQKYEAGLEERHFQRYLNLTRGALAAPENRAPAIVAWPESAIPYLLEEDPGARAALAALLKPGDLLLVGGEALQRDASGEVKSATNSLFVVDQTGTLRGRYDKAHLVPLGEYVPARDIMTVIGLARLTPGDIDFLPGPGPRTLTLPGFPAAGIQICYEMIFPAAVVDPANRPGWLLNISNDAWFGPSGPPQHMAQARLRAIEEGLPVARATPTGVTGMIDARGRVVATAERHRMAVVSARLPDALPPTLFARFGHWTSAAFGLLLLAAAWASRKRI